MSVFTGSSFAGKAISPEQISKQSELGKDRNCVSCGERIRKGHICECQEEGAITCPSCKRRIKNPEDRMKVERGAKGAFEVRLKCRRLLSNVSKEAPDAICPGYLYTFVYTEDFVPHDS